MGWAMEMISCFTVAKFGMPVHRDQSEADFRYFVCSQPAGWTWRDLLIGVMKLDRKHKTK